MQMLLSAAGNGAVQSEAAAFECEAKEKGQHEAFTSLNATWKWKPRAKLGRSDAPAVQFTRKALKVALYGTTQFTCANETDCVQQFKSADLYIGMLYALVGPWVHDATVHASVLALPMCGCLLLGRTRALMQIAMAKRPCSRSTSQML
jgi:hypothetical protein